MTGERLTIQQAAVNLNRPVVYMPEHGQPERGKISSVTAQFVFVRYGDQAAAKATRPQDLIWASDANPDPVKDPLNLSGAIMRISRGQRACGAPGCEGDPIQAGETYRVFEGTPYHLECGVK